MKKRIKLVLAIFLVFALTVSQLSGMIILTKADTTGNVYYIDSIDGSDENTGTSADTAWQSLSKVNSTEFSAGERKGVATARLSNLQRTAEPTVSGFVRVLES